MDSNKKFIEALQSELNKVEGSIGALKHKQNKLQKELTSLNKKKDIIKILWSFPLGVVVFILFMAIFFIFTDDLIITFVACVTCVISILVIKYSLSKINGPKNRMKEIHSIWRKDKKELDSLNNKAKNIKAKLNTKKDNSLQSLIIELKSELDLNNDNTVDVIQHENEFYNLLKSNQSIILDMEKSENRDFTKQFVKLSNFLVEKEKNLQSIFKRISDIKEYENFEAFKSNLIDQIQFYNILRLNSLQMISSFIDDDRITFYMIYEKLDKLGVWNTNFENQFLIKMDLLNSNINRLISEIKDMSQSINSSISELIFITQENTDSVTNKLKEIGSKLETSNLLNTINTYQNYKTNQRLK